MSPPSERDIRVTITTRIWGLATGMLGICVPIVAITENAIVPIAVVVGATVGTLIVWRNYDYKPTNKVKELEQRVANLETISSSQELELINTIKQLESKD